MQCIAAWCASMLARMRLMKSFTNRENMIDEVVNNSMEEDEGEKTSKQQVNLPRIVYFDARIVHRIWYYGKCNLQQLRDVRLAIKFLHAFFHQYPTYGCDHAATSQSGIRKRN